VEEVEDECVKAFGLPEAVLLPSARAGIAWVLIAHGTGLPVLCPAFTCREVWFAIQATGAALRLVDLAADGFLMDPAQLASQQTEQHALILGEIYGYPYALETAGREGAVQPSVRILDLAMSLPSSVRLARAGTRDVVLLSFGVRKCLSAGWGGVVLTRDSALATELRQLRQRAQRGLSLREYWCHNCRLVATEVARTRALYRPLSYYRHLQARSGRKETASVGVSTPANSGIDGPAFTRSPSSLNRSLIAHNLRGIHTQREHRRRLAALYRAGLNSAPGIQLPPETSEPLSHFTVRVTADFRAQIIAALEREGIGVGTLFHFSTRYPASEFPNAARIAREVLNLPMHTRVSDNDVAFICSILRQAVASHP